MTPQTRFQALLERLGIRRGALVYLHTSFSRLTHLDLSPGELLDEVLACLGPSGTLVLPSFAWNLDRAHRPWKGYADYYRDRPVFDVRTTPTNIGVVPESFRHFPGVRRSVHFWWSVAACGPLSGEITAGQERVTFPYGPESSFGRMHRLGTSILGLGVTLNTTSLAPVVDHALGSRHTQHVFSAEMQEGIVRDDRGRELATRSFWLLPDVVRLIKPAEVCSRTGGLGGTLQRADCGDTIQFAYPFDEYFSRALALGEAAAVARRPMPWLEDYPLA